MSAIIVVYKMEQHGEYTGKRNGLNKKRHDTTRVFVYMLMDIQREFRSMVHSPRLLSPKQG